MRTLCGKVSRQFAPSRDGLRQCEPCDVIGELEARNLAHVRETADLRGTLNAARRELADVARMADKLNGERLRAVRELERDNPGQPHELADLRAEVAALRTERDNWIDAARQRTTRIVEMTVEAESWAAQVAERDARIARLRTSLSAVGKDAATTIADLTSQIRERQSRLDALEKLRAGGWLTSPADEARGCGG
jgi:chromosome segregation ATPase